MKSVQIVYRRPNTDGYPSEFRTHKSIKKSVDQYLQRLKEKQQNQNTPRNFTISIRPNINTAQTSRVTKYLQQNQMTNTINIAQIKYSTQNIFKHLTDRNQNLTVRKQNKFRSTFVKKNNNQGFFSLKGIKTNNHDLFTENKPSFNIKRNQSQNKNASKLVTLKKVKPIKQKTILISVDFILNEFNFWTEQKVDQNAHKNWKILQQYSNIVWLTRRQNSFKKLQKFSKEYGLRLDGVYKIQPNKRTKSLLFSLSTFEKYFLSDPDFLKKQGVKKELILINSLKVDTIKSIGYEQFYDNFPLSSSLKTVVHFIQIDMSDRNRFNSPLKILSKQKLPNPNQINHIFVQFYKNHKKSTPQIIRSNKAQQFQEEQINDQQNEMQKFEEIKERFLNYFGNHLKLNLSKKVKTQDIQQSLQYLIGDMLKRNFNLLSNYQKQAQKITSKLQKLKQKNIAKIKSDFKNTDDNESEIFRGNFVKNASLISIDKLLTSKLNHEKKFTSSIVKQKNIPKIEPQQTPKVFYKEPVFLWRK